jgi:cytidylate kinase
MIRVVTIGGEYGSNRAEIGRHLAGVLGWRLLDNELIEQIAARAHVDPNLARQYDECSDPWFHRVQKALWRGGYEGVATTSEDVFDADRMAEMARIIIAEAARQGNCIVVGRGGQCVLQQRPDAFHVFVYAPYAERVERLRRRGIQHPEREIAAVERRREAYIRRYYGQDWTNRHLYHLMICSSVGEAACVATILTAMEGQRRPE